jgi:chloramphenicol 3-O phosphotransferase
MAVRVIVLNGTSSSGKSSIARCLQSLLPEPWLTIGVDDLITAVPPAMLESEDGLTFTSDGEVIVGPGYRKLEEAWSQGVAAMARAGTGVIPGSGVSEGSYHAEALERGTRGPSGSVGWGAVRSAGSNCPRGQSR